jgi:hypothetical protein
VSQISLHNALIYINTISAVFGRLCRAILQQQELHHIALAPPRHTGTVNNYSDNFAANVPPVDVTNETAAQAWSIHQGLLFLNGRLYTPATSPLQVDRLNALLLVRPANMRLPALYLHQPSTAPDNNAPPSAILLGRPGPQTITSPTTVIFLDALERQLLRVGSAHIPKALKEKPGLSTNIGGTATMTWSLHQVIIVDSDRYFYLQVPSSLCPHLLDSLHTSERTTNQHLIAKSFYATTTSTLLSAENGYINTPEPRRHPPRHQKHPWQRQHADQAEVLYL